MSNTSPARPRTASTTATSGQSMNLAVLRGELADDPVARPLASGGTVVQFDLRTCAGEGGTRVSVPVSWGDPPASAARGIRGGTEVSVLGWTRRRFFRSGGATQSRTEVVAVRVVPTRRQQAHASLIADAVAILCSDDDEDGARGSGR